MYMVYPICIAPYFKPKETFKIQIYYTVRQLMTGMNGMFHSSRRSRYVQKPDLAVNLAWELAVVISRIGFRCWWDHGTVQRDQDSEVQVAETVTKGTVEVIDYRKVTFLEVRDIM